ncbi:MAG: hypothetical protein JXA22_04645 [Candidatus Thermoplasmatota archaeon]|nr:hypothetical protein [Candidatus Thermoplasmatota archaeon]
MDKKPLDHIGTGMDGFFDEFRATLTEHNDRYLEIYNEERISHIEDRLYDQIIVYMGDKVTERKGKKEDIMDIAVLAFLIWLRKEK